MKVGGTKRWEYDYSSFHPLGNVEYPASARDDAFAYGVNLDPDLLRISEWNWAGGDTVRTIDYAAAGQVTAVVDSAFGNPTCEWYDDCGELCYGGTALGEVDQASSPMTPSATVRELDTFSGMVLRAT